MSGRRMRPLCAMAHALCIVGAAALGAASAARAQSDIGVVLMHGKQAMPDRPPGLADIARQLQHAGIKVVRPHMPWAAGEWERISITVEGAHALVDAQVARLRAQGARRIVVGGHSLGANVALSYAVARDNVAAVLMLGPGHSPGFSFRTMPDYRAALERAAKMVGAGQGAQPFSGPDNNQGRTFTVSTTAEIYVNWMSPRRLANMQRQAPLLPARTPLLLAIGAQDPAVGVAESSIYQPAAKHPYSKYIAAPGDHRSALGSVASQVVAWVRGLPR